MQITERSQTAAAWLTMPAVPLAGWALADGASAWWLLPSALMYAAIYLANTAGAHRLFSHRSYDCSDLWKRAMSLFCTLSMQGSVVSWAHVHVAHHALADTTEDPHVNGWGYMLNRRYRPVDLRSKIVARLLQDPWHRWLHYHALVPVLLLAALMAAVDPLLLLFGYLAPLGYFFFVTGVHMAACHRSGEPVNVPWMEILLPMGEWRHRDHHDRPASWDYGPWDFGSWFIRRIKR